MMLILPPAPDLFCETDHAWADDLFTPEELRRLISIGDTLPKQEAQLEVGDVSNKIRKNKVSWIEKSEQTDFVFNRLAMAITKINAQRYQFDLFGLTESIQFTVYDGVGDHYTWHTDSKTPNLSPRKLSMVLLLSDPSEYSGGELQLFAQPEPFSLEPKRGRLFVFPSYVLHRVTPITRGVRKSLVAWVCGNKFR